MRDIPSTRRYALRLAILGTAIFLATNLAAAWQKSGNPDFPVPVWPACAIALAGMWFWGRGMWPAFFLPVAISAATADVPWSFALLAPASIALCLAAACAWMTSAKFDASFRSLHDTKTFLVRGALFPMFLAGFATAFFMSLAGIVPWKTMPSMAFVYGLAYAAGCVLLTPAIMLTAQRRPLFERSTDAVLPLALLALTVWLAYSGVLPDAARLTSYVPFPFIIWAAWKGGLPAAVAAALIAVATAVGYSGSGGGPFAGADGLAMFVQMETYIAVMATTALLAGSAAEALQRETKLQLDAANREAEAQRLKAQLQPHFLFNALAAIHSNTATNPEAARAGILSLADLLRTSLDNTDKHLIPLRDELRFVINYIELQRLRFEWAIEVTVNADEKNGDVLVLPMMVQTLVENAFKHGDLRGDRLRLQTDIFGDAERLVVRVGNDIDPAGKDPSEWKAGTGLSNLRERLRLAWGDRATFELARPRPDWIEATISITKAASNESLGSRG
jgi:hypothetical protein